MQSSPCQWAIPHFLDKPGLFLSQSHLGHRQAAGAPYCWKLSRFACRSVAAFVDPFLQVRCQFQLCHKSKPQKNACESLKTIQSQPPEVWLSLSHHDFCHDFVEEAAPLRAKKWPHLSHGRARSRVGSKKNNTICTYTNIYINIYIYKYIHT